MAGIGVVEDVQAFLALNGYTDGSSGWTSVRRFLPDEGDQFVMITEDGGPVPDFPATVGVGSGALAALGVMVMVRAAPYQGDDSYDKAEDIRLALHGKVQEVIGSQQYFRVYAMTGHPVAAGVDEDNRPIHTVALRLEKDAA